MSDEELIDVSMEEGEEEEEEEEEKQAEEEEEERGEFTDRQHQMRYTDGFHESEADRY